VLEQLDHPHIVRVIELLEDDRDYFIVMELMPDGNLLDMLNKISKARISFTERDAANLIYQVMLAISYMHESNTVHRDLKLENLMVQMIKSADSKQSEMLVKVTDFGFACFMDPEKDEKLSLGSPLYTAPEVILSKKYDNRCDVWSLGVMAYMMLCGRPPFSGVSKQAIYKKSLNLEPDYSRLDKYWH